VLFFKTQVNRNGSIEWHVTARSVHRYSRLVYFRSLLLGFLGETTPTTTTKEIGEIRKWTEESKRVAHTSRQRVDNVILAIKAMGLPKRHRRHAVTIATNVYGKNSSLIDLNGDLMLKFSRYFRFLEHAWMHSNVRHGRVYFVNYRFLIRMMCEKWKVDGTDVCQLKSRALRVRQERLYTKLIDAAHRLQKVKNSNVKFEF